MPQLDSLVAGLRAAILAAITWILPIISPDPRTAFDTAFSVENLAKVFDDLKAAKRDHFTGRIKIPTGYDRVSLADFERQRDQHLAALSRKALDGRYTFRPSLYRDVPKGDGSGMRRICFPGIRDGIAQRALHQVVVPAVDRLLTPAAYAYRQGYDTHRAIHEVFKALQSGKPWVFESDLEKFFDRLDHDRLRSLVDALPIDPRAHLLVWRFMRTGDVAADLAARGAPKIREEGVPQGGVLSGTLANLYMAAFDDAMRDAGYHLVRYADDLLVVCPDKGGCEQAKDLASAEAAAVGLTLHPRKTHIIHANDGVDFLGFRVRGTLVSVRSANVRKFKGRIRAVLTDASEAIAARGRPATRRDLVRLVRTLRFKVEGVGEGLDRRSWLRYFRIVNDLRQLRVLDRFVADELRQWARKHVRADLNRSALRALGHRFLVTEYWRVRRQVPTRKLRYQGFVPTRDGPTEAHLRVAPTRATEATGRHMPVSSESDPT